MALTRRETLVIAKAASGAVAKDSIRTSTTGSPKKVAKPRKVPAIIAANSPNMPISAGSPKKSPSSPKKSPRKKTLFEDSVAHINVLPDHELPVSFVEFHKPEFIKGVKHILAADPTLYRPIVSQNFDRYKKDEAGSIKNIEVENGDALIGQYWLSLMSSIMSQQISGKAAAAIYKRFEELFESEPNPKELLTKSTEELRAIGLSGQKVKYVTHICEVFSDPQENLTKVEFYRDNELPVIVEELVKLKGIGEWSAKMFALFTLREWDVFAHDDLGIARGAAYYLNRRPEILKEIKQQVHENEAMKALLKKKGKFENSKGKRDWVPYHDQYLIQLSKRFAPYRSILMIIFYRLSATTVDILEETGQ